MASGPVTGLGLAPLLSKKSKLHESLDGPIASSILPQSSLGEAVNYLKNHWDVLLL